MSRTTRFLAGSLLLLTFIAIDASSVFAQASATRSSAAASSGYVVAAGTTTFGFAPAVQSQDASTLFDALTLFPAGSDVPHVAKPLIEKMWRTSPTFRRQCARLAEASVVIVLTFDYPPQRESANAETMIRRDNRLRAHIRMRGADSRAPELLAHEIEHILEQVDEVDLSLAVAERVRGVRLVRPNTFETARAIAIGRIVAREFADGYARR
jgi:hypothetical protein